MELPALPPELRALARHLPGDAPVWLVGGAVRDLLLGRPLKDVDLATAGDPFAVARRLARGLGGTAVPLDVQRGVARVALRGGPEIDVAALRGPTLEADLGARDFTLNAMAATLAGPPRLIDPHGGADDLAARRLRLLGPAVLEDDPLRGLRGLRLAAELELEIEPESRRWIGAAAPRLAEVAGERVRDELLRVLAAPAAARWLREGEAVGLLAVIVPELDREAREAALERIDRLAAVRNTILAADRPVGNEPWGEVAAELADHLRRPFGSGRPRHALLLLGALLGGRGPEAAVPTGRLEALRLSRAEAQAVAGTLRAWGAAAGLVPSPEVGPREVHRFFREPGAAGIDAILLALADRPTGSPAPGAAALFDGWFRRHETIVAPPRLLDGDEVAAALGTGPGPAVGAALARLAEEQAAGTVATREEALAFLRRLPGEPPGD